MPQDNVQTNSGKMRREEFKEMRRKRRQQQRLLVVLAMVGAALLIVALAAIPAIQEATAPIGEIKAVTARPRPQAQDNAMGDPNAPVKIEEFSDYQCPRCKEFSEQTEPQIIDTYIATGKVYFVYHTMGEWIGPESKDAAEAAYCAGEQNKYWEYHDMLFANWNGENEGGFKPKRLVAFGESLSLDMTAFRSCVDGNKFDNRVAQDKISGEQYGVTGTPSFAINGKLVILGAQPFSEFQSKIEAALAGR